MRISHPEGTAGSGLIWLRAGVSPPFFAFFITLEVTFDSPGKPRPFAKLVGQSTDKGHRPPPELLKWAEAKYDVVVVDTPAVLPVADTTIFANQARAVIIVIDANRTRTSAAQAAVSRLAHVRGNVVGVVLNRADQRAMGYLSYYGGRYGYGYRSENGT